MGREGSWKHKNDINDINGNAFWDTPNQMKPKKIDVWNS